MHAKDMVRQLRYIYARGNTLIRNFYNCCDDIKLTLFRSYLYNIYCCQLWTQYSNVHIRKLIVAYNNIFRHLFNIKHPCSMSMLYMFFNVDHFTVLMRRSIVNFKTRLLFSTNSFINAYMYGFLLF